MMTTIRLVSGWLATTAAATMLLLAGCQRTAESGWDATTQPKRQKAVTRVEYDEPVPLEMAGPFRQVKPGDSPAFENIKISDIAIRRDGDGFAVTFRVDNTSSGKVVKPCCYVKKTSDENGNELTSQGDYDDRKDDQLRDLQPGESGRISIPVSPKLKAAKRGMLWINTEQGRGVDEAKWRLDFEFPAE